MEQATTSIITDSTPGKAIVNTNRYHYVSFNGSEWCLEDIIIFLEEKKKSIYNQMLTYYLVKDDSEKRRINTTARSKYEYEKRIFYSNQRLEEVIDRLKLAFAFSFKEPNIILYGTKGFGNYRECIYGITDSFKNAIWIHTHVLEEMLSEFPNYLPVHKDCMEYINMLNNYYKVVSSVKK